MSFKAVLVAGVLCALGSAPAQATEFVISALGTVSDLHNSDSLSISGAFNKGNLYSLNIVANLSAASLWFESNDKTTAFYNVPIAYNLRAGSYSFSGNSVQTISITNNTNCSGFCTVADSAYLLSLGFSQVSGTPPFDLGAGTYYQSLDVAFFDISGTAFNGTGLDQLTKVNSFSAPTLSYQLTQVNSPSSAAFATFTNTNYSASVTGAVPESSSWAMMIVGMGAVGFTMRRREKVVSRVSSAA